MANRKIGRTSGQAMIVVVCVLCVLLVLSFSLLLSSGTLLYSSGKTLPKEQCRVWAVSLSHLLDSQFTGDAYTFDTRVQEDAAATEYPDALWFYLREHIGEKEDWAYYNEDERGHSLDDACRAFTFDTAGLPEEIQADAGTMQVVLYWESEKDAGLNQGTALCAEVSCTSAGQTCTITSRYSLTISQIYPESDEDGTDAGESDGGEEQPPYEQWVWSLDARE